MSSKKKEGSSAVQGHLTYVSGKHTIEWINKFALTGVAILLLLAPVWNCPCSLSVPTQSVRSANHW